MEEAAAAHPLRPPPLRPEAIGLQLLATHDTPWTPQDPAFKISLNLALDGCIVPTADGAHARFQPAPWGALVCCTPNTPTSARHPTRMTNPGGARTDYTRVIVMDGFLDDATRQQLLDALTEPGWAGPEPPPSSWERATCDAAPAAQGGGAPAAAAAAEGEGRSDGEATGREAGERIQRQRRTWGLKDTALRRLAETNPWPKLEVQSRLCKLYPGAWFAHMPSAEIQAAGSAEKSEGEGEEGRQRQRQDHQSGEAAAEPAAAKRRRVEQQEGGEKEQQRVEEEEEERGAPAVDCAQYVANAAVAGDAFSWHVDADPAGFPDSPWVDKVGRWVGSGLVGLSQITLTCSILVGRRTRNCDLNRNPTRPRPQNLNAGTSIGSPAAPSLSPSWSTWTPTGRATTTPRRWSWTAPRTAACWCGPSPGARC
jgi:hypothetical protein